MRFGASQLAEYPATPECVGLGPLLAIFHPFESTISDPLIDGLAIAIVLAVNAALAAGADLRRGIHTM